MHKEVGVALSESVLKFACSAPWWRTDDDVISGCQLNLVISETMHRRYKVAVDHFHEVLVA